MVGICAVIMMKMVSSYGIFPVSLWCDINILNDEMFQLCIYLYMLAYIRRLL